MPNRILKESIRTSKTLNAINDFQFRLWAYLITYVDDFGRGSADPEILKGIVFTRRKGITEKAIEDALAGLANSGLINLYDVGGEPYFCFPNWEKHQQIRAKRSKFPAQDIGCNQLTSNDINCPRNPIQSESNPNPNPNPESESNPNNAHARAFDRFWSAYPKKIGKIAAKKAFNRVSAPVETLVNAIERQKCGSQWTRENGRYIPNPATWLNQGRWEDEPQSESRYSYDYGDKEGSL